MEARLAWGWGQLDLYVGLGGGGGGWSFQKVGKERGGGGGLWGQASMDWHPWRRGRK